MGDVDLASLKKELDSTKDELSVVKTALTGLFLVLVLLTTAIAFGPLFPGLAEPAKLITLSEVIASHEHCAHALSSMFTFFPASRSMMVQYDNTNTDSGFLCFKVFEVDSFFRTWCDFHTNVKVTKTDFFGGISEPNFETNDALRTCLKPRFAPDPDFFTPERFAFIDAGRTQKYAIMSLVRGFTGADITRELRRMAAAAGAAGMVVQ